MPWPMATLLAVAIATHGAPVAFAHALCAPRDHMVADLADKYGEVLIGGGVAGPTQIIELRVSAATGSWTITMTTPIGLTCVMAAGSNWQTDQPRLPPGQERAP